MSLASGTAPESVYIGIKELSAYLGIKVSTLYAWAAQGKIPSYKIHGLIRFKWDEVNDWLQKFRQGEGLPIHLAPPGRHEGPAVLDCLIARAKRDAYTPRCGKPDQDRAKKGGR
jgi:excisionase family DNA binding protein